MYSESKSMAISFENEAQHDGACLKESNPSLSKTLNLGIPVSEDLF